MRTATKKKSTRSAAARGRVKASLSYGITPRSLPENCSTVGGARTKGEFGKGADLAVTEATFASRNL